MWVTARRLYKERCSWNLRLSKVNIVAKVTAKRSARRVEYSSVGPGEHLLLEKGAASGTARRNLARLTEAQTELRVARIVSDLYK